MKPFLILTFIVELLVCFNSIVLYLTRSIVHPYELVGSFQLVNQSTYLIQLITLPKGNSLISGDVNQNSPITNFLNKCVGQSQRICSMVLFSCLHPLQSEDSDKLHAMEMLAYLAIANQNACDQTRILSNPKTFILVITVKYFLL